MIFVSDIFVRLLSDELKVKRVVLLDRARDDFCVQYFCPLFLPGYFVSDYCPRSSRGVQYELGEGLFY